MIGKLVKAFGDRYFSPVNKTCSRLGVTKAQVNLLEIAAGCAAGIAYAAGWAWAGWALLVAHGFLDYLDGGTRRTRERSMKGYRLWGWDTHVIADKIGDVAVCVGLALGGLADPWLALLALASSVGVTVFGQLLKRRGLIYLPASIFERADKVLTILVIGPVAGYSVALLLVCGMNAVLFAQRTLESAIYPGKSKRPGA